MCNNLPKKFAIHRHEINKATRCNNLLWKDSQSKNLASAPYLQVWNSLFQYTFIVGCSAHTHTTRSLEAWKMLTLFVLVMPNLWTDGTQLRRLSKSNKVTLLR